MTDVLIDDEEEVPSAPMDNLVRSFNFRASPSDDGLTLDGYGAVFNAPTEIDSWEGKFTESIAPGAFKRSLGQRTPVLQFDHGQHPLIGSMPIGVIRSIGEDAHGLKVRARLSDNWLIQPVRDAIRDGGVTGMSIRFRVVRDQWNRERTERTIREVQLYEVGPVVFPAYAGTSVGVRSRQVIDALNDPEVRAELARLLASGTDLRSLADADAPDDDVHAIGESPASADGPRGDARASAVLALARARTALA